MKKILFALLLAIVSTSSVMAQDNFQRGNRQGFGGQRGDRPRMTPEQMAEQRTKQMVERYNLNDEQAQKLAALNKEMMQPRERQAQNDSVRQARPRREGGQMGPQNGNRQRGWGNMGGFGEEYAAKLKEILTPEQYAKYEEDMQQMRNRMRQGQGQRGNRMRGNGGNRDNRDSE